MKRRKQPKHGTVSMYRNYSCRCSRCRAAQTKAMAIWRKKVSLKAKQEEEEKE